MILKNKIKYKYLIQGLNIEIKLSVMWFVVSICVIKKI